MSLDPHAASDLENAQKGSESQLGERIVHSLAKIFLMGLLRDVWTTLDLDNCLPRNTILLRLPSQRLIGSVLHLHRKYTTFG